MTVPSPDLLKLPAPLSAPLWVTVTPVLASKVVVVLDESAPVAAQVPLAVPRKVPPERMRLSLVEAAPMPPTPTSTTPLLVTVRVSL